MNLLDNLINLLISFSVDETNPLNFWRCNSAITQLWVRFQKTT
jgi:hypothetical protein